MASGVFEQGIQQGIKIGKKEAMFNIAIKYKHENGIDEAVRFSGFSREELEKEELNRKDED